MINATQAAILGVLHEGAKPGARIEQAIQPLQFYWRLTKSQLYRELPNLVDKGMLSVLPATGEKARTKDVYAILPQGKLAYRSWCEQFTASHIADSGLSAGDQQRNAWMLRVALCRHDGIDHRPVCREAARYYREHAHMVKVVAIDAGYFGSDVYHGYQIAMAKWFEEMAQKETLTP